MIRSRKALMFWGRRMSAEEVKAMVDYARENKGRMSEYVITLGTELLRRMRESKRRELRRKR